MTEQRMIPIGRPTTGEAEAEAARRAILSGWVTQGPEVAAFEREFAAYVGAEHAIAVSNCTTALHLALLVIGVKPGDEVVTVSHSFIATANSIRYCGAVPVFVDIDPATFNVSPEQLERALSPKTRAILVPHQIGMPADMRRILDIARARRLPVIEDAACAIGSEILWDGAWQRLGRPHGDVACFSFHPRKVITTGDGGMITTGNAEWAQRLRLLRQHGMSVPDTVRHGAANVVFEEYAALGFNYRMTDVQAAVGREQLRRLDGLLVRRRALAKRYSELLRDIPGVRPPVEPLWARSNWQSYAVYLPGHVEQRSAMERMLAAKVATRRGVMCAHRELAYPSGTYKAVGDLTHSEAARDRVLLLPLFDELTDEDQARVAEALRSACTP